MNRFWESYFLVFINKDNVRHWVKFDFVTQQGIKNLSDEEARKIVGMDRESSQRDLFDAIDKKDFPKWKMFVQIMTEERSKNLSFSSLRFNKSMV